MTEAQIMAVVKAKLTIAAEIVTSKAKRECPVDTGYLRGTITHDVTDDFFQYHNETRPWFAAKHYDPKNVADAPEESGVSAEGYNEMVAIIGANAEYAPYVEGKYKPFLQIALTSSLGRIKRLFER